MFKVFLQTNVFERNVCEDYPKNILLLSIFYIYTAIYLLKYYIRIFYALKTYTHYLNDHIICKFLHEQLDS